MRQRHIYIAGLSFDIPEWAYVSHAQGMEGISTAATLYAIGLTGLHHHRAWKKATAEGGNITALPKTTPGKIVTPIHTAAICLPPTIYLASVLTNGMYQAEWFADTSLPIGVDLSVGIAGKATLRAIASVGLVLTSHLAVSAVDVLGAQFHYVGTREKGRVISVGPYSYVRHPIYSLYLGCLGLMSVAHWSWVPLAGLVVAAGAFAYKIPIEEGLIEEDLAMGSAYAEYKKNVQYRLIPYVW